MFNFRCTDCGGSEARRSRPRNSLERYILPVLLLRPVRCENCYRRTFVFIFVRSEEPSRPQKAA